MSRLTAIVNADEVGYEQITKQLHKLVSVYTSPTSPTKTLSSASWHCSR